MQQYESIKILDEAFCDIKISNELDWSKITQKMENHICIYGK